MPWSTREIAELAGTSLRAVRHYHDIGLLEEPDRRSNGYKQYGVEHLVRLLRIKRLVALGFSLTQIDEMRDDGDSREDISELQALDEELEATIERLQQARAEVGALLRRKGRSDVPLRFAAVDDRSDVPEADRRFLTVMDTVLGDGALSAYADLLDQSPDQVALELDDLPADADEEARRALAERLVGYVLALRVRHSGLDGLTSEAPRGHRQASRAIKEALTQLYNPAQVDVMNRVGDLLAKGELPG
ncbi:MerR family transcriptional regulator [Streptomyces pakalii]|uniref:MerR family transcriptional regulator n=1 Tax=Streptomyces pakalii TaxID=3036494 RepID=A0ABT7DHW8_9ACTN|nr:MerR family transcriptional regulator [Streptomyces pakalii]MDJ1645278.1 MerR family transcriptional regulator [Streptomyces pakalii]